MGQPPDEFQLSFEEPDPLTDAHINAFERLIDIICEGEDDAKLADALADALKADETLIYRILQLTGGTRSKLKTDLEAQTAELGLDLKFGGRADRFVKRDDHWSLAQPYLIGRIRGTFQELCLDDSEALGVVLRTMNQATWPGYVRQQRAKLSGHEAERRMAVVLAGLGIPFVPEDKATTRGSPDVQFEGQSFDLAVPDAEDPVVLVVSGVQAGNIGQFGESKAQDTKNAADMLDSTFEDDARPILVAFVDGVGYWGNAAGLKMILETVDEFAQFKTLWKLAAVAASQVGHDITIALPPEELEAHADFIERYDNVTFVALTKKYLKDRADDAKVQAGEGIVFIDDS